MKTKLFVLFIVIVAIVSASPLCRVKTIAMTGLEMNDWQHVSPLIQELNWFYTSSKKMNRILESHYLVESAVCTKKFPFALEVKITKKAAFAAIQSGAYFIIIDNKATVIGISESPNANYVIEGFHVKSSKVGFPLVTESGDLIEKAVQLVQLFDTDGTLKPDMHLIDGQLVQMINDKMWINFGQGHDVAKQFTEALTIYNDLVAKKSTTGIINLSIPGQSVVQSWKE